MSINLMICILLPAIATVESNDNHMAVGDGGKAWGLYQLHMIAVKDVNQEYGRNYRPRDRYDKEKSKTIAYLYLRILAKRYEKKTGKKTTLEVLARCFNGGPNGWSKSSTKKYWQKIKAKLKK